MLRTRSVQATGVVVRHRRARIPASACAADAPGWSLGGLPPAFLELASSIEGAWRVHSGTAGLQRLTADPRFAVVDGGHAESRIRVENRFYGSAAFRKCHLEVAVGNGGLAVLHCVMYPWPEHDLPLFSVDMVAFGVRTHSPRARRRPAADAAPVPRYARHRRRLPVARRPLSPAQL